MDISSIPLNDVVNMVGKVLIFDIEHTSHVMETRTGDARFIYEGFLSGGFHSFTLMNVCLTKQAPVPILSATKDTVTLGHQVPTWESLHSVIDVCCGFGGMAQGATAAGFEVVVAVDQNPHMVSLHSKVHEAFGIVGDVGSQQTIAAIWQHARGASVLSSGFSCQPFSRLGDCRGEGGSRSDSLTKTLNAAMLLRSYAVVLECVAPAAQDSFVAAEIARFCKCTGLLCSQTELRLDHVWPCRRHRSWWIFTAPEMGEIKLRPWPALDNLWEVQQVIPEIRLWDLGDENQLSLNETELEAFGVIHDQHAKHMLNCKGVAPCALHAWGSQTCACPCGCRQYGFSQHRLETKGLHGCLVRSAVLPDGTTNLRHLHPNEVMGLNSMDPVLDYGEHVKLTLSAAGQLASPVQALWVFGFLSAQLDELKQIRSFDANAQIQAYRSWLLMRCRLVWPAPHEFVCDAKLLAMMGFWREYKDLSLAELVFPMRWEDSLEGSVNIASVLDHIIRTHENVPATIPDVSHEDEPTPWFDAPVISDDPTTVGCMQADSCTVVIEGSHDSPIRFQPTCCATVEQFLKAHAKLVESLDVESITLNGVNVPLDHVMEVGQVIILKTRPLPSQETVDQIEECISPTATWSQPIQESCEILSPPRKVSKFDVGECSIPGLAVQDQPWLDATPFLHLQGEQFLKLTLPNVVSPQQLWSLRHQFFKTDDRLQILDSQAQFWANDEIRFHLYGLATAFRDHQLKGNKAIVPACVIDPLISTAWVMGKGFDCKFWAKDHPEIAQKLHPIITVVLIEHHWVPVYMTPVQGVLHAFTWDRAEAQHEGLNNVLQQLASALGFESALICREHRLFFTSELCGSLAIAFLRNALVGTQLPADCGEAVTVHAMLRSKFAQTVQRAQITDRPWIWGAGDQASSSDAMPVPTQVSVPTVNISRDQRIDLINENGTAMADDEIRFHLLRLIEKQPTSCTLMGRTFTYIEPLIFNCWKSIGKTIVEQWCTKNPEVFTQGLNVITAFSVDGHWLPVRFAPRNTTLQVHMFHGADDGMSCVAEVIECIAQKLGFLGFAIHRVPEGLSGHSMCGAHAMCFLAHVVMGMPLPEDVQELRTLHTNMRAAFVEHLYAIDSTPRPVIWGTGKQGFVSGDSRPLNCPEQHPPRSRLETQSFASVPRSNRPVPLPPGPVNVSYQGTAHSVLCSTHASNVSSSSAQGLSPSPVSMFHMPARESGPLPIMPADVCTVHDVGHAMPVQGVLNAPDVTRGCGGAVDVSSSSWEYGPLPRMPAAESVLHDDMRRSRATQCTADSDVTAAPQVPDSTQNESARNARLLQVTSHSYAMADDEMHFQLQHLLQCHSPDDVRKFHFIPPLAVHKWINGDHVDLNMWISDNWNECDVVTSNLLVALLFEQHWIPVWITFGPEGAHVHTLANFVNDEPKVDTILRSLVQNLRQNLVVIHRVPHGIDMNRLCGAMTISFFAHIMLRSAMPASVEELQARCWAMKEVFAEHLTIGPVTQPTVWGWGLLLAL